jgi:serine/threonine protein kinase
MNKEAALASLGLQGSEDHATVARVYGERLAAVQAQLVSAASDAERNVQSGKLSQLSEAYEFVTATGRYTKAPADDVSATVMRSSTQTEMASPPRGDTFVRMETGAVISGRHEIGELLGQGGMGNVYAARDRLKEEDVAIKVLRQDLQFSIAAKERFLAEAKMSCSLSHPNIVRVHDVGVSGSLYYFSMERLKGHTLRQRIDAYRQNNRLFSVTEVSDVARQLIDALRYAHRSIVHRDLKPENIWLADDGTVKLMDFGIARAFSNSQLTQTGMALGTAYYMSPEQRIGSKEIDWRTDQYALGVVLYELLAGTLPTGAVQPIENLRKDLPKRYARALMRAMAPMPEDRFASLSEMMTEIDAPQPKRVGLAGLLLIGAGLAAAAAGAFVVLNKQGPGPAPAEVTVASEPAVEAPADTNVPVEPEPSITTASADGSSPVEPPAEDASTSAAAVLPEPTAEPPPQSAADAVVSSNEPRPTRVAKASTVETSAASSFESRRKQCVAQCERDDGECRSLGRRGKQDCMRAVAFGNNSGRITTTNPAAASCSFFGRNRCDYAMNRDACVARMTTRYKDCVDVLGGTVASGRQDCENNARESDQMCLDTLRECRDSCQ